MPDRRVDQREAGARPQLAPLSRRYLRAVHDFEQPLEAADGSADSATKSNLTAGDIVMVHLTNSQGWADGTILNTGRRGWLPASYCKPYDHENVRAFFHGLSKLWHFCNQENALPAQRVRIKDEAKPLVQGVRQALETVNCLSREDVLVKTVMSLQWTRKSLLSRLAALVKGSDRLAQQAANPMDEDTWIAATSDFLQKAFEVATGLVTFMDAWKQHNDMPAQSLPPPPPAKPSRDLQTPTNSQFLYELPSNEDVQPSPAVSQVGSREQHGHDYRNDVARSITPKPFQSSASTASLISRPSETDLQAAERADRSMMDLLEQLNGPQLTQLASVMLTGAQTDFFENLRTFLKLYTQSGPKDEIDMTVLQTLGSSSSLITTIHKIRNDNPAPRQSFDESIKIFSQCLNNLAMSLPVPDDAKDNLPSFINPTSGAALISVATICIRAAAQSVAGARRSLEEHGDFEIASSMPHQGQSIQPTGHVSQYSLTPLPVPLQFQPPLVNGLSNNFEGLRIQTNGQNVAEADGETTPRSLPRNSISEEPPIQPLSIANSDETPKRSTLSRAEPNTSSTSDPAAQRDSMLSGVSLASTNVTGVTNVTAQDATSKTDDPEPRARASSRPEQSNGKLKQTAPPGMMYTSELIIGEKGRLLGGTPRALVEHLIHHTSAAALKLEDTFFLTFKAFVSAEELADLLTGQYKMLTTYTGSTSQQRKRIFDLIKKWVTKFWDTELNVEARARLEGFANDHTVHMLPILRQRLLETIRKADVPAQKLAASSNDPKPSGDGATGEQLGPTPELTKIQISMLMSGAKNATVLDFSPLEIARQLTLMSSQVFCAVKAADLLSPSLNKGNSSPPNILALSRLATSITNLVSHTIVFTEDSKKRVAILKQWIKIAEECLLLQNYDTLMAIMCSLNSAAVSRLHKTWRELPPKVTERADELKDLCEVSRNFGPLRQRLMTSKLPCLPFIGIFLTDLTFVDAGNGPTRTLPSTKDTANPVEVVNFDRYARAAAIVNVVQRFQLPFRLQEVAGLRDWLRREMEDARVQQDEGNKATGPTTTRMFQQSLALEPNGTATTNALSPPATVGGAAPAAAVAGAAAVTGGGGGAAAAAVSTPEESGRPSLRDAEQKKNVLIRKRQFEERDTEADTATKMGSVRRLVEDTQQQQQQTQQTQQTQSNGTDL